MRGPAKHPTKDGAVTTAVCIVAILGVAAIVRLVGLAYGLPHIYNQDEVAIMSRALAFAKGDPNPHNFLYPTLYFYALFVWEALFFLVGRVAGWYHSVGDFQRMFFVDPSAIYLAGRVLTACCGTITVFLTYRMGRVLYGPFAGIAAALFLALSPFAVIDSHYVKHDAPVTVLLVAIALVAARAAVAVPPPRRAVWAGLGVLVGLATSTHYYAVFGALPVVALAIVRGVQSRRWRETAGSLVLAGATAVVVFAVTSPFVLTDWPTAVRDMAQNRQIVLDRAVGPAGPLPSLGRYLTLLSSDAMGAPIFVLSAIGLVLAFARDWRRGLMLAGFPLAFLLFIANTVPASRYLTPTLPFFAIGAAIPLALLRERLGATTRLARGAVVVAAAAAVIPSALATVRADRFLRQTDTRTLALAYIETHVPPGASILVQPYSVPMRQSREGLVEALRATLGDESRATIKFQIALGLTPYPSPAFRTLYLGDHGLDADKIYISATAFDDRLDLTPLRAAKVEYVVLKRYNVPDFALRSLEAALERGAVRVAEFSPYRPDVDALTRAASAPFLHNTDARIAPALERPGPIIDIWKITQGSSN